jgi:phosphate transport system permease protein
MPRKFEFISNWGLLKRHIFEVLFKFISLLAVLISISFLFFLIFNISSKGYDALWQSKIKLEVIINHDKLEKDSSYKKHDYNFVVIKEALINLFPQVPASEVLKLNRLISTKALDELYDFEMTHNESGSYSIWLTASDIAEIYTKNRSKYKFDNNTLEYLKMLDKEGRIKKEFSLSFFTSKDSRDPELAGIAGSFVGTMWVVLICIITSFPISVFSAIYLEEFAPKNSFTNFIEVNINNLASVPSIVYGLLGLSIFIGIFNIPRSSVLAGGLTLSLMMLPTIIIATRQSIRSIPNTLREAVLALGATHMQLVFHQLLPLSLPGIMTGIILSISRVIGETAPLIMVGMVAFIVDIPGKITDPATVMPVQIYLWSQNPELVFVEKTSAAIIMLLLLLVLFNILAVIIRKKYEIRW